MHRLSLESTWRFATGWNGPVGSSQFLTHLSRRQGLQAAGTQGSRTITTVTNINYFCILAKHKPTVHLFLCCLRWFPDLTRSRKLRWGPSCKTSSFSGTMTCVQTCFTRWKVKWLDACDACEIVQGGKNDDGLMVNEIYEWIYNKIALIPILEN